MLAKTGERVVYAAPTHELARQVQEDLTALGVRTHYWREGPTEEDNCPEQGLVRFFRDYGYVIRWGPCRECAQRKTCAYRTVYTCSANKSAQVLIITSWHMRRPDLWTLAAMRRRGLVILDEDALGALTAPAELTVHHLQGFIENLEAVRQLLTYGAEEDDTATLAWLKRRIHKPVEGDDAILAATDILRRAADDIMRACAGAGHGRWAEAQDALVQGLNEYDAALLGNPDVFDGLLRCAYAVARRKKALPNLFASLQALLLAPRPVHVSSGACRWPHRPFLPKDRAVLLLDATAEPDVVRSVLDRPVDIIDTPPIEQTASIIQLMDRIGTRCGSTKDLAEEESWIRQIATAVARRHRGQRLLCVTFKQDEETLQKLLDREHGDALVVHYGALRGLNAYGGFDAALILGRPMPNEAEIQLLAVAAFGREALAKDLHSPPLEWRLTTRTIGPDIWTVRHQQYADPRWAAVWRHIVTGELVQAIGRLRPLVNPAVIYVGTNEPLPPVYDVVAAYAGEVFPEMALSGRRADFGAKVRQYADAMQEIQADGREPTNSRVCERLGLKEPNGLRYRALAVQVLGVRQSPRTAPTEDVSTASATCYAQEAAVEPEKLSLPF